MSGEHIMNVLLNRSKDELFTEDPDIQYKNELQYMQKIYNLPMHFHNSNTIIFELQNPAQECNQVEVAKRIREEGNIIFKKYMASRKNLDTLLAAIDLYTKAIMVAENQFDELCLAYANRAIALQQYGFYKQAYDDCLCALDHGYPENRRVKLYFRQAWCAWKLGKPELMCEHLKNIDSNNLNESNQKQFKELEKNMELLMQIDVNLHKLNLSDTNTNTDTNTDIDKDLGNHLIKCSPATDDNRGRYMVASRLIPKNNVIFKERAECFVPTEDNLICQNCAATLLIPIPCPECHQRVIYCSRDCREKHKRIHTYECAGYKCNFLPTLGISQLALRMVITYMPKLLPHLCDATDASSLWAKLIALVNSKCNDSIEIPQYIKSIRMISHLHAYDEDDILKIALSSNLARMYLDKCTDFIQDMTSSPIGGQSSHMDWNIFISALILRFSGQLIVNGHASVFIVPVCYKEKGKDFPLLIQGHWHRPYHMRRGHLHMLTRYKLMATINLPHLSLCNHSCIANIRTRYNGVIAINSAHCDIPAMDEIFNSFTSPHTIHSHDSRSQGFQSHYRFQCNCEICLRPDPDDDLKKFFLYRCEYPTCRKEFTPLINPDVELEWWLTEEKSINGSNLICPKCSRCQEMPWFALYLSDERRAARDDINTCRKLFKWFDNCGNVLLGYHAMKLYMAYDILIAWFSCLKDNGECSPDDALNLERIITWLLEGTAQRVGADSIEYLTNTFFLLDLHALGKIQLDHIKLQSLQQQNINMLSNEYQVVYMNYYNDYLQSNH